MAGYIPGENSDRLTQIPTAFYNEVMQHLNRDGWTNTGAGGFGIIGGVLGAVELIKYDNNVVIEDHQVSLKDPNMKTFFRTPNSEHDVSMVNGFYIPTAAIFILGGYFLLKKGRQQLNLVAQDRKLRKDLDRIVKSGD